LVAQTDARTDGHSRDFILCPMLCIALDRQQTNAYLDILASMEKKNMTECC